METDKIFELITKWKISHSALAKKIGMRHGTFYNKINPKHPAKFKANELLNLRLLLSTMVEEFKTI